MPDNLSSNKRIAKNTLLLYVRMLFLLVISLLTSRYVLQALGVTDYGIYNVVGGFVSFFSLISGSLTSASSRFINYEIGKGKEERLITVFSTSVIVHYAIAIIIAILCETIGLYYLNNYMVIPESRLVAANWCFQISIFNFCTNIITIPYNSAIIAHEKMSTFAYVSIFEGVSKLLICFVIMFSKFDHLILYALLMLTVQLIVRLIYQLYCKRNFKECKKVKLIIDKPYIKQMFSYSGWHIIGNGSGVLKNQGVDLIINYFFGPVLNAAKGVANAVLSAVSGFASNFMIAINPQITQSYAREDLDFMFSLVYRGARFSYYLLFFLSLPIIINADCILHIWLTEVPDHAVLFVQLALIITMISSVSNPLIIAQNATGNVRNYQLIVGGVQLLNLPLCYVAFKLGMQPEAAYFVAIAVEVLSLLARLYMIPFTIKEFKPTIFIKEVIVRCSLITVLSVLPPVLLYAFTEQGLVTFIINVVLCFVCSGLCVLFLGCTSAERTFLLSKAKEITAKFSNSR